MAQKLHQQNYVTESSAGTILAGRYTYVPVGTAILLLAVTPVMNGDYGWPFLAAAVMTAALGIPIVLHERVRNVVTTR
nr:hypothetical protein [uncultured Methanoregula sp.]